MKVNLRKKTLKKKRIINETIKDLKPKSYNSKFVIINRQYHEHFLSAFQIFKDNIFLQQSVSSYH